MHKEGGSCWTPSARTLPDLEEHLQHSTVGGHVDRRLSKLVEGFHVHASLHQELGGAVQGREQERAWIRKRRAAALPKSAALWIGVLPSLSAASRSAPASLGSC